MQLLKEQIKAAAEKLGFCLCGFTGAEPLEDFSRYTHWLEADRLGTMTFLKREDHIARRADPHTLLPESRSICVLAVQMGLFPDDAVASYAHYTDYHDAITSMAEGLITEIRTLIGDGFSYRICVDSAPILERSLAVRAGLGWIGKSSMFVSPQYGSALFLCEILLSLEIPPDEPFTRDFCGKCHRCIDACPNRCIDPDSRTIQADHCIAYLTIEHKGEFTDEQSRMVGGHLFGCDECLRACPWNSKKSPVSPIPVSSVIPTAEDGNLSEAEFKEKFRGTSILRTKAKGIRRNAEAVGRNQRPETRDQI